MNILDPWTSAADWQALSFVCDLLDAQVRELRHGRISLQAPGRQVVRLFPGATAALAWVEAQLDLLPAPPPPARRRQG